MTTTTKRFRALLVTLAVVTATNIAISKVGTIRPWGPRPKADAVHGSLEATSKVGTIRPWGPRPKVDIAQLSPETTAKVGTIRPWGPRP